MEDIAMKTAKWLAVAAVTLWSLPLMAQQAGASAEQNGSVSAAGTQVNDSARAGAQAEAGRGNEQVNGTGNMQASASGSGRVSGEEMRPVNGELESKLDAKSARPGDRVVFKTNEKMRTADGTEIPKGSRLVGHVTEVQAHGKGQAESRMGIEFDRAELKGGQSFAIHSVIESVAPPASAMMADSMSGDGGMGGGMMGGGRMGGGGMVGGGPAGGGRTGGGLIGGTVGGVSSATGQVGSGLDTTAGGALNATGHVAGDAGGALNATGSLAGSTTGALSGAGSLTAHATGIPGVMLSGDATGSASGVLSDSNKNIHLDSGTQMVLGVSAAGK
jgi:hypothetical protein